MLAEPPNGEPPSFDLYRSPLVAIFVVSDLLIFLFSQQVRALHTGPKIRVSSIAFEVGSVGL